MSNLERSILFNRCLSEKISSSSSVCVEECVIILYMHSLKVLNIGIRLDSLLGFFYQKWNKKCCTFSQSWKDKLCVLQFAIQKRFQILMFTKISVQKRDWFWWMLVSLSRAVLDIACGTCRQYPFSFYFGFYLDQKLQI